MALADVANGLVNLCRQGKFMDAINQYYSADIVSVEPVGNPQMPAEMQGIDSIRGKNQWFTENNEVHGLQVDGPFVGDDQFAVRFNMEVTPKASGQRTKMTEVAVYTVKDDKVVKEEFYYHGGG